MKKIIILAVMMLMTISANAMSYNTAKHKALFLSDKMAYELNLTAVQHEAVHEINLNYLISMEPKFGALQILKSQRQFLAGRAPLLRARVDLPF